jgi:hypothetical protein
MHHTWIKLDAVRTRTLANLSLHSWHLKPPSSMRTRAGSTNLTKHTLLALHRFSAMPSSRRMRAQPTTE